MQMTWAGCPNFKGSLSVARWANLCNSINATRGKLLRKPRWWLQELVRQWCTVGGFCRSGGGRSLRPENLGNKLGFLGKINIKPAIGRKLRGAGPFHEIRGSCN